MTGLTELPGTDLRELAIDLVRGERSRQLDRWGDQSHSDLHWLAIQAEEHGEAAQAILDYDITLLIQEVVQVTAVGLAWLEDLLRREHRTPQTS